MEDTHEKNELRPRTGLDAAVLALAGAYVLLLPWMFFRLPVIGDAIPADLIFPLLAVLAAPSICAQLARNGNPSARPFAIACGAYLGAFAIAAVFSANPSASMAKCARVGYLASLGICFAHLAGRPGAVRFIWRCWFLGLAAALAYTALGLMSWAWDGPDIFSRAMSSHFGSLPPGPYRRPVGPFRNFNMFATYLAMGAIVLLPEMASPRRRERMGARILAGGALLALAATLSPAIGAWLCGASIYVARAKGGKGSRIRKWVSWIFAAGAFALMVATAVSPREMVRDGVVEPSPRLLTWRAAVGAWSSTWKTAAIGWGPGTNPFQVEYRAASGQLQRLEDAHNVWLSVATQAGWVGVAGLAGLMAVALRELRKLDSMDRFWRRKGLALGAALVGLWGYAGLAGSFEDTRHFWVLLGLAAGAGGMGRTPDADVAGSEDGQEWRGGLPEHAWNGAGSFGGKPSKGKKGR